jgi:hypothetical protein
MKFSLRTLLILAAVISVLCACLVYPRPIVGDLFYTFGLLLAAYSAIAVIYFRGPRRAFWVGFLILFGGYFCHTVWPSAVHNTWAYFQENSGVPFVPSGMITTRLIYYAYEALNPLSAARVASVAPSGRLIIPDEVPGQFIAFMTVAQTTVGMVLGIAGGLVAQRIAGRRMAVVDQLLEAERKINH